MPLTPELLLPQDPSVLASAPLGRIYDQRATAQCYTGQPARNQGHVLAVQDVRAKIDMACGYMAIHEAGGSGQRQCRLGDVVARLGLDQLTEVLSLFGRAVRTDEHSIAS